MNHDPLPRSKPYTLVFFFFCLSLFKILYLCITQKQTPTDPSIQSSSILTLFTLCL
ncbi:hypothetical protein BDA99DRAFT_503055 [Phascolomyces articulosus]|uniref:Uncharacterized protein n=1 Tax=Phascolomyces articulosus TaxID=60185 RepID=A0AAD5PG29_9FUNG|nr:hypothetical protein BDA99DRAFT_503055 [Phascolomyces articulosus]